MSYTKEELIQYRIQRSKECLEDGRLLLSKKSWNAVANRLYYAAFYAVSAYAVQKETTIRTHSGLKTFFNKELVLRNKLDLNLGRVYNSLFNLRQEADYEDFFS